MGELFADHCWVFFFCFLVDIFVDPERLSAVYMISYPLAIYSVYKIIEPLMDMRTRRRIEWVKPISNLRNLLYKHFDPQDLPSWLCGTKSGVSPNLTFKELHEETLRLKFCTV